MASEFLKLAKRVFGKGPDSRTHARAQTEWSRVSVPSSPKYRVRTLDPREKPRPKSRASGNCCDMKASAFRVSSVCPAEYSRGLVTGTPAPVGNIEKTQLRIEVKTLLTASEVDNDSTVPKASFLDRCTSTGQDCSDIWLI